MDKTNLISGIRDNHNRGKVGEFPKEETTTNSKLSEVSSFFTK